MTGLSKQGMTFLVEPRDHFTARASVEVAPHVGAESTLKVCFISPDLSRSDDTTGRVLDLDPSAPRTARGGAGLGAHEQNHPGNRCAGYAGRLRHEGEPTCRLGDFEAFHDALGKARDVPRYSPPTKSGNLTRIDRNSG